MARQRRSVVSDELQDLEQFLKTASRLLDRDVAAGDPDASAAPAAESEAGELARDPASLTKAPDMDAAAAWKAFLN